MIATLSMNLFGCVEGNLSLESTDSFYDPAGARLSVGKFRLMGSHSLKNEQISSAKILVTGLDVRSTDGEFFEYAIEPFVMDLIALQQGAGSILARVKLPAGEYDLLRIHTAEAGEASLGGEILPLIIPSGEQSGLKVFFSPALRIEEEKLTVGFAEFDLSESFVVTGGPNAVVHFKPVLRVSVIQPVELGTPPVINDDTSVTDDAIDENTDETADETIDDGNVTEDGDVTDDGSVVDDGGTTTDGSLPGDGSVIDDESTPPADEGSTSGDTGSLPDDSNDEVFMPWIGI